MSAKEIITHEVMGDVYTQADYARLIGITPQTLRHRIRKGQVNTIEINGGVLIRLRN